MIKIHGYIEANNTAYIIMEYIEGIPLSEQLKDRKAYTEQQLKALLYPILDGLKELLQQDIIHQDINPSNIIIRDTDQSPVLLGFESAEHGFGQISIGSVFDGYFPIEQYHTSGEQGSWTDIYSLGAIAYKCLTGERPVASIDRVRNDPLIPAVEQAKGQASESFLRGIDAALSPFSEDRPQSIDA